MTGRALLEAEPPSVQRIAALIEETGYVYSALAEYVFEEVQGRFEGAATSAQVSEIFPALGGVLEGEAIPEDEDEARDRLLWLFDDLDALPDEVFSELGFSRPTLVLTIGSSTRSHYVDLGLFSSAQHDWWYAWLGSNVGNEYYTHVAGPVDQSRDVRRAQVLDFIEDADYWIESPGEIQAALVGPDLAWLKSVQTWPVTKVPGNGSVDLDSKGRRRQQGTW